MLSPTIIHEDVFPRDVEAIPCPRCNGYCDEVEMTKEEIAQHDCGKGHQCCAKVFICRVCDSRIITKLEAPEANFS